MSISLGPASPQPSFKKMWRRRDLVRLGLTGLAPLPHTGVARATAHAGAGFASPTSIYINWGAYDELSDNVLLSEKLALQQLDEILRLRQHGVRFDHYLMDCFWFDQQGSYRTWDKKKFPRGGGTWLARCRQHGLKPGLWIGTNATFGKNPQPVLQAWKTSHDPRTSALALFSGGYLDDLMNTLQVWYDRGVRLFKFDFANFRAAPEELRESMTAAEIYSMNAHALQAALGRFRRRNQDVAFLAYNGFDARHDNTFTPPSRDLDQRWLRVFDAMYCGDPRFSDVPMWNIWRSMDVFSDHMVRRFAADDIPLSRIDASSFMIAKTGTGYHRGKQAFRGMLVLSLARGSWANTIYGNLELLNANDAGFFARAQKLFLPLQALGQTFAFGPTPGNASGAYGWANADGAGAVYTVVNPTQSMQTVDLPLVSPFQAALQAPRLLFRDSGFVPTVSDNKLVLGPEQMAVVGFGRYADESFDLGQEPDVSIPVAIDILPTVATRTEARTVELSVHVPAGRDLRVIVQQEDRHGQLLRSSGGAPPKGKALSDLIVLQASQNGADLPMQTRHNFAIWSGLSWAAGTVTAGQSVSPKQPVTITASATNEAVAKLRLRAYSVKPAP